MFTYLLSFIPSVCLNFIFIGMVVTFIRLAKGPSIPDRVMAIDVIANLSMGMIIIYSVIVDQAVFLDVALAIALIMFLGTVAFAHYLEKSRILR